MAHIIYVKTENEMRIKRSRNGVVYSCTADDVVIVIANVSGEFRFSRTNGKWKTSL